MLWPKTHISGSTFFTDEIRNLFRSTGDGETSERTTATRFRSDGQVDFHYRKKSFDVARQSCRDVIETKARLSTVRRYRDKDIATVRSTE